MRYKKYIEPLWNLQKEQTMLLEKVKNIEEEISHIKQEIFLEYGRENKVLTHEDWVVLMNSWENELRVFTKDEYEKFTSTEEQEEGV